MGAPVPGCIWSGRPSVLGRVPTVPLESARVEFGLRGAQVSRRFGFPMSGGSGGGLGAVRRTLGLFSPGAEVDDIAHGVLAAGLRAAFRTSLRRIGCGRARVRFGRGVELTGSSP